MKRMNFALLALSSLVLAAAPAFAQMDLSPKVEKTYGAACRETKTH